jgi:tRNA(fMet)-specific endonuclease VapC
MYLIDTNICIFLKNKKPHQVLERLKKVIGQRLFISSISVAEMEYGIYNSQNIERNRISLVEFLAPFEILNFDSSDAEIYGIIRSNLKKQGQLIGPYDMLIAAQAISKELTLVTNNTKEFIRIQDIKLEDWV